MNILFLGDVVGRSGRQAVIHSIPKLRQKLNLDAVIVNIENAAGGFGMTEEICEEFFDCGVDVLTSGNHFYDQKQIKDYFDWQTRLIRPLNYPAHNPGKGVVRHTLSNGQTLVVINVMGQLFMAPIDNPFNALEDCLQEYTLKTDGVDAIIVDAHAETNSEKMVIAHMLDGRVSGVFGTHTHIPTADARILTQGTGFITDVGMCGDYNSSVGMNTDISLARFRQPDAKPRLVPAMEEASLGGVYLETDERTGLATTIKSFRQGRIIEACALAA
ncbi:MAG: TIGR00282 family metallophosphoesterase [Janthinobacterium lividum]